MARLRLARRAAVYGGPSRRRDGSPARTGLAKDPRTRGVPALSVRVEDGTANLEGFLPPDLHDLAGSIAQRTKGVHRLECRITDKGTRHSPMSHVHTIEVPALPPPPG